jgi:predicted YcjX-like family ATPase
MSNYDYYKQMAEAQYMGQAQAADAAIADEITQQSKAEEKRLKLEAKKAEKLERLGKNQQMESLTTGHTIMPGGNLESNANKIWNDANADEIQKALSDAANQHVYVRYKR